MTFDEFVRRGLAAQRAVDDLTRMTDDDLVAAAVAEFAVLEAPIELVLRPTSAFQLASLLQLALRHPGPGPDPRRLGHTIIAHVRGYFQDAPALAEMLRRGDDPGYDVRDPEIGELPELYDAAKHATHAAGLPWTDPRTGIEHPAPPWLPRLRYRVVGGHVHARVFVGPDPGALAGELTFAVDQWPAMRARLDGPCVIIEDEPT